MKEYKLERAEKWRHKKYVNIWLWHVKLHTKITNSHKIVNINLKNMAVIQPRPTHILYQCAKFGDDRTSFNVIFDVCDV